MRFQAQIKEIKRLSTASMDTEYSIRLITETPLTPLIEIRADELVNVEIKANVSIAI